MQIEIKKGRLLDPANNTDQIADVFISDGVIAGIGKAPKGFKSQSEINAKNQIVCPGLVDLCARLREPGQEHKATIASETLAAAASGITAICCPPDTTPVIDTPSVVELIFQRSENSQRCRIFPLAALTHGLKGKILTETGTLKSVGCVGVSNACVPVSDTEVLRRALEYATTFNMTAHLYCADPFLNNGVMHEGAVSTRLGLPAIPETAETIAISRALLLAEQTEARVHFCRISSARGVELLADAKSRGLNITADVSIAHLHLTDMDIGTFNTNCLVIPPFRSQRDQQALRTGLADGTITVVCSDHQPHESDAKSAPFSEAEPGISSIEMLLPLMLRLVNDKVLSLSQVIEKLSSAPADILGIQAGGLAVGALADLCIFDSQAEWTVDEDKLLSAGKNTPFNGWQMTGKVTHTIVNGNIIYPQA